MTYELLIQHQGTIMLPPVVENVSIEWERQGQPGKLIAEVVKTPGLSFQEGDPCRFSVDGTPVFYGFVFEKSRKGSTDDIIQITVYDQLYYLKNKDTYVYTNKTAADVIRMIAEDFQLNVGDLEDTGYTIGSRVEDNQTLFDIIQTALDETLKATSQMYVLYDDVGKLTLKNIGSMKLGVLIDEDTAGDFDYKSSIASQTYDKIKLSYENKETVSGKSLLHRTAPTSTNGASCNTMRSWTAPKTPRPWRTPSWTSTTPKPARSSCGMCWGTSGSGLGPCWWSCLVWVTSMFPAISWWSRQSTLSTMSST